MPRPPFRPNETQRRRVTAAAAGGMSHEQIADALGIGPPTLRKHFRVELDTGAARRRMDALDALLQRVRKGHVGAIRTFLAISRA